MNAKEFLMQAYLLDQQIKSKSEQVESLNELATRCTPTLTGMPGSSGRSTSQMADAIGKIIDLEAQIGEEAVRLVEVKQRIVNVIQCVDSVSLRVLLERRYLCGDTWEKISVVLNYDLRWTKRLHERALEAVQIILEKKFPEYINKP